MEATRTDLSDKLEKLEDKVMGNVQDATSAVAETVQQATATVNEAVRSAKEVVESVKETVQGTMGTVKDTVDAVKDSVQGTVGTVKDTVDAVRGAASNAAEGVRETFSNAAEGVRQGLQSATETLRDTFDLPAQVDRHPWLMMGGAVAVGFAVGKLMDFAPDAMEAVQGAADSTGRLAESFTSSAGSAASAAASTAGGLWSSLEKAFGPEMNKVKEMALGALVGIARDMAVQAAPPTMSRQVGELFDSFTSKLGGKPVEGSVLGPRPAEEEAANGPGRRF